MAEAEISHKLSFDQIESIIGNVVVETWNYWSRQQGLKYLVALAKHVPVGRESLFEHKPFVDIVGRLIVLDHKNSVYGEHSERTSEINKMTQTLNALCIYCFGVPFNDLTLAKSVRLNEDQIVPYSNLDEFLPKSTSNDHAELRPLNFETISWQSEKLPYNITRALSQLKQFLDNYGSDINDEVKAMLDKHINEIEKQQRAAKFLGETTDTKSTINEQIGAINKFLIAWLGGHVSFIDFATKLGPTLDS